MTPLIIGNWKMNGSPTLLEETAKALRVCKPQAQVAICPPAVFLKDAAVFGDCFEAGAQTCAASDEGAQTGEISVSMLRECGARRVIVGHSERRAAGETDKLAARKAAVAQDASLTPIFCVGESAEERSASQLQQVLERQLVPLFDKMVDPARLVIAYEPVWAIGSGRVPEAAEIVAALKGIGGLIHAAFGAEDAKRVPLLYDGSVTEANAGAILRLDRVSGLLVGGASLTQRKFAMIALAAGGLVGAT